MNSLLNRLKAWLNQEPKVPMDADVPHHEKRKLNLALRALREKQKQNRIPGMF